MPASGLLREGLDFEYFLVVVTLIFLSGCYIFHFFHVRARLDCRLIGVCRKFGTSQLPALAEMKKEEASECDHKFPAFDMVVKGGLPSVRPAMQIADAFVGRIWALTNVEKFEFEERAGKAPESHDADTFLGHDLEADKGVVAGGSQDSAGRLGLNGWMNFDWDLNPWDLEADVEILGNGGRRLVHSSRQNTGSVCSRRDTSSAAPGSSPGRASSPDSTSARRPRRSQP